ncbi:MAG TPA: cofactor-independent phosphoglycerate mutase [Methanocorpusculum sp.]|nr:cofactor-independent phosphoglycerate mutase [Methanocorpusculum sp.]
MKYILVLGDGMTDKALPELGNHTPLESAKTPNMDTIASGGKCGIMYTIPPNMEPGSDVANMSILGYDPNIYYTSRGALEATSMGVPFNDTDYAYRCNLVTIENNIMKDFTAGHISSEESKELFESLQNRISDLCVNAYPGISYRNVLMVSNGKGSTTKAPHDIIDKPIDSYLPSGDDADLLRRIMDISEEVFKTHKVNRNRVSAGKNPATTVWPWTGGIKPNMPKFTDMFGKKGAMISAVDLLFGLAKCTGMSIIKVDGATGYLDTNYLGKAKAAVDTVVNNDIDFVYMHVEATDEASHLGSVDEKIKAIESLDGAVGYILDNFDGCVMLMPDHYTPISIKTHTRDPVPFAVYGLSDEKDAVTKYTEKEIAEKGEYGTIQSTSLLNMVFKNN